jgi:hypothetical protein
MAIIRFANPRASVAAEPGEFLQRNIKLGLQLRDAPQLHLRSSPELFKILT